jgi:enterochelin esterase-like enzyme
MVIGLRFDDFEKGLPEPAKDPTHYTLVVGSKDADAIEENQQVERILKKKKFPVTSSIIEGGGHSQELIKEQLPGCLEATFGKKK